MYPLKVSKSLNVGTQPVKPPLTGRKVVTCVSRDHCSLLPSQNAFIHAETLINSDSGKILPRFRRNWASFFFLPFFYFLFFLFMHSNGSEVWGANRQRGAVQEEHGRAVQGVGPEQRRGSLAWGASEGLRVNEADRDPLQHRHGDAAGAADPALRLHLRGILLRQERDGGPRGVQGGVQAR